MLSMPIPTGCVGSVPAKGPLTAGKDRKGWAVGLECSIEFQSSFSMQRLGLDRFLQSGGVGGQMRMRCGRVDGWIVLC